MSQALSRHTAEVEQSRGYDLAHRLCDSCWGPLWAASSPVTPLRMRATVRLCSQSGDPGGYMCADVCHRALSRAEYGSRESERASGELSPEGRWGLQSCPHVFCHLIHSFSTHLIYTAWGLERAAGFRRQPNVLTDFWAPLLPFPSTRCGIKARNSWILNEFFPSLPIWLNWDEAVETKRSDKDTKERCESSNPKKNWAEKALYFRLSPHQPRQADLLAKHEPREALKDRGAARIKSKHLSFVALTSSTPPPPLNHQHVVTISDVSLIKRARAGDVTLYNCRIN